MKYSNLGLLLTERSEGLRLRAYLDGGGVPTIGYGHTKGVKLGQAISQAQAETYLKTDVVEAEQDVERLVTVPLTQGQFDALVDFVFNLGGAQFATSTLLKKINAGDYVGAGREFDRWVYDDGVKQRGLVLRRDGEEELWNM